MNQPQVRPNPPPGFSVDGSAYWDGASWRRVSPDRRYFWDETAWMPVPIEASPTGQRSSPTQCQVCGRAPVIKVHLRRHEGLLLVMRFGSSSGTLCQGCGVALYRDVTARNLLRGWWGFLSYFVTWGVLAFNLIPRYRLHQLGAPQPETGVSPTRRPPLDPGNPVYLRPEMLVGVAVLVLTVLAVLGALSSHAATPGPLPTV